MASTTFRWGIISTGRISGDFVKDLLVDPKTRDVHDVAHKVTAVGSRTVEKAKEFIDKFFTGDASISAYGDYAGVYNDPNVDGIYIGTPHTLHYDNARDGIMAGKHILCEKPVTSNVAELKSLLALAKEHNVFFMEALWTRFHPLPNEVKKLSENGALGEIQAVHADLSFKLDLESLPTNHRMIDPKLGGGALLDLGPYPNFWATLLLYENPANANAFPSHIAASMLKTPLTGVDATTSFTLTYSTPSAPETPTKTQGLQAQAYLTCSMSRHGTNPGVQVRFSGGNILVAAPIFCPKSYTIQYFEPGTNTIAKEETKEFKYAGSGWHWQADEVARCVRDGKLESELWTHDKSILEMSIFDEVRRQGGYELPAGVEKVV